ncbi:MAG: hypothetical protein ABR861_04920 [Terriglobales bacterium]|jgi:hypothetical protein
MAIALVQSNAGGSASGSGSASYGSPFTLTSSAVGFGSPTTPGNLLVCVVWFNFTTATLASFGANAAPTTPGFTWTQAPYTSGEWDTGNPGASGFAGIYYVADAAAMSALTTVLGEVTINAGGGTTVSGAAVEFALYEFSGVATSPLDTGGFELWDAGSPSTPAISTDLPTTTTDLVIACLSAKPGGSLLAGSGFTLGISASVATIGQSEYQLNVAAGSVPVAFTGTESYWVVAAVAFKAASGSGGTGCLANAFTYTPPILDVSPTSLSYSAIYGGSNPAAQNISVSNGDGGTLSWTVSSDESWLSVAPGSGTNSGAVAASVDITGLAVGTYTGHLTFSASGGAADSPQTVTVTLSISSSGGGGGPTTGFTPTYPPIKKQPFGLWGLEAKRADSVTVDGVKKSVLDRIDTVTTLHFPYVVLTDMAAWKAFEAYALTGGIFTYRPILDYPNAVSANPMFQYPGTDNGDDAPGYSVVQLLSMDWTPKFESFQIFSLDMKLRLVADQVGS